MNKSKIATEIINDIYTFNFKYENAKNKFGNGQITETKYANGLYILLCKTSYLLKVINKFKEMGYKFARYEKEVCALYNIIDQIATSLNNSKLEKLSIHENFSLVTYLTKYENILKVFKDEELKDKVEHN